MNKENFEYLSNNLKYLGFGEDMNDVLFEEMQKQVSQFQLSYKTVFGKDAVEAILHFRKSNINEIYFFDKYYLHLRKFVDGIELVQPFYIFKGKGITCKEAYNLLCGRAINKDLTNKEGQTYNAWLQLDLSGKENESFKIKQYHQNYGFDLLNNLIRLPIKELSDPLDQERLIKSLERGNLQLVVFIKDGAEIKLWIAANPRFKIINVYDANHRIVKEYSPGFPSDEILSGQKSNNGLNMNTNNEGDGNVKKEEIPSSPIKGIGSLSTGQQRPKRNRISI